MLDFSTDNTALIKELKSGNTDAYTFLVEQYNQKLCVYAFSLSHDHNLAEDIVQNVFIRVWQQRNKFKNDFVIQSFLYKLVYNEFIDQYRKMKSTMAIEKKYIDALDFILEEDDKTGIEKLITLVKKEIENLPPKCKRTFLLSKQEGLTNIEIAEYLNVSIKTVEAQITKAFSIIRKKVGNKTNGILFLLFGKRKIVTI
ncbi:RNA polymerase sigma factor [Jejuia spongiicola]|uniref:RNA polymerase sigma-70 factor n=1 Tax=Jejuia spongiicola TaxID=2942207 RepID=A0ABT0QJC4_9FLAO|nr:RNA polymerase sigma-70 factor [Jejuia spongiicola]MCL6296374.1 RNA polymerase sigma-70 factor [Jejuia spongiicola]PIA82318.1 RNA polymerase sigma-70 factor [Gaetbulibacter sp. 4G1]